MLISLLLFNFWFTIVIISSLIGCILFIVSIILFLKKKNSQNSGKFTTRKGIAIVIFVVSLLFLFPLGITITGEVIVSEMQNSKDKKIIEAIENKIIVQENEWKYGFEYNGKYLVPLNILMNSDNYEISGKFKNLEKIGALVIENSYKYYSFYKISNDSGYNIYYVGYESFVGNDYYSRTFVDKNEYESILNYYNTSNFSVSALWKSAPEINLRNSSKKLNLNINDKCEKLIELFHNVLDDVSNKKRVSTSVKGDYECMLFTLKSNDNVFTVDLCVYTRKDEMIVYLNEYKVENEIVEKYKEILFSLINDSQTELLQQI